MTIDNKTSIAARILTTAAAFLRFWPLIAIALLTSLATSLVLAHPLFIGSLVAAFYIRGLLRRSLQKRLVAHSLSRKHLRD